MARGRYIARQDSDDISFPCRLSRLAEVMDAHPEVSMISSATVMMGPGEELLMENAGRPGSAASTPDSSCHGSLMFRRDRYEQVGGYREQFWSAQDIDLRARLTEVGPTHLVPEVLYAFRVEENSISAFSPIQKTLSRLASQAAIARREGRDDADILAEAARVSASRNAGRRIEPGAGDYFIGRCLYRRRDRRALRYLWASCRSAPASLRCWLAWLQAFLLTRSARGADVTLTDISDRSGGPSGKPIMLKPLP